MFGIAIAGLLFTSPGNPQSGTVELFMPGFGSTLVISSVDGFTARLEVTTSVGTPPTTANTKGGSAEPSATLAVASDSKPAEEWNFNPKQAATSGVDPARESDGSGWTGGGTVVGAVAVGVGMGLAAEASTGNLALGVSLGIAGLIAGGIGGYYLGLLASHGSWVAKFGVIFLTVVEVVAVIGGVVAGAMLSSEHMSSLSLWGTGPAPL